MICSNGLRASAGNPRLLDVIGLLYIIRPRHTPPYPLTLKELCVFLALADCRGTGLGHLICESEDTGDRIFWTPPRQITFSPDPLDVLGVRFRVCSCSFPGPGLYSIQFWYNGVRVEHRLLSLR
jgi:hypothetical protein